jgi:hypothetical protein
VHKLGYSKAYDTPPSPLFPPLLDYHVGAFAINSGHAYNFLETQLMEKVPVAGLGFPAAGAALAVLGTPAWVWAWAWVWAGRIPKVLAVGTASSSVLLDSRLGVVPTSVWLICAAMRKRHVTPGLAHILGQGITSFQ